MYKSANIAFSSILNGDNIPLDEEKYIRDHLQNGFTDFLESFIFIPEEDFSGIQRLSKMLLAEVDKSETIGTP